MFPALRPVWFALAWLLACACAEDRILPVDSQCGDGQLSGAEECDPAEPSPGCLECVLTPGYTCTDQTCVTTCGDGLAVGDEECDSDDRTRCDSACRAGVRAAACDVTGWWIARQTTVSIDDVFNEPQTSSNWFLFHFAAGMQAGSFVVDRSLNCGIAVSGSKVDVNLTPGGIAGLLWKSPQQGSELVAQRVGSWSETGQRCTFDLGRAYFARGLEDSYLPPRGPPWPEFSDLPPLPTEADPTGAVDDDGDGQLGIAFVVSRGASGVRNTAQRDWAEFHSDPAEAEPRFQIAQHSLEFAVRARFDNEESILAMSQCPPAGCGPLRAGSTPSTQHVHFVTLRYLGEDLAEPRVAAVVLGMPRENLDTDLGSCENVRSVLPHASVAE